MEVLVKRKDCEVVFLEENNGMCVVEGIHSMLPNSWKGMKLIDQQNNCNLGSATMVNHMQFL